MRDSRHFQLADDNYYSPEANMRFFSVSQYKDFMKCEAMAMAKIRGEYEQPLTKPLLIGKCVDSYFEGTLIDFLKENKVISERTGQLYSEFKKASEIIERVKVDPLFMKYMSGEKQKILTFEMLGSPWKIKMDSFIPDTCITDLKVVANFHSLVFFRYDLQGAVYQAGVEANGLGRLPFYLAAATKEKIIDLDIFQVPQSTLDMALREIEKNMPRFIAVKSGMEAPHHCGKCDYCKAVKAASIRNYNELLEG